MVARSALHVGHLRVRRGASLLPAPQPRRLVGAGDLLLSVTTTTAAATAAAVAGYWGRGESWSAAAGGGGGAGNGRAFVDGCRLLL